MAYWPPLIKIDGIVEPLARCGVADEISAAGVGCSPQMSTVSPIR